MKIQLRTLLIVGLAALIWSCKDVKEWNDPTDDIPPGKVTNIKVENFHGGATITYELPDDKDLLAVKAVYSFHEGGKVYENFSSAIWDTTNVFKRDTIVLVGYPDTTEHIVNLYTIDLSRNESEPEQVIVKPLLSPVDLVRKSLKVNPTFGGVYCSWENIMEENIAVSLYVDSVGEMTLDDTYFSKAVKGGYTFRGFPSKEYSFRIEIRDRWLNYSIPLDTMLTPLYEQQIKGRDELNIQQWYLWGFDNRECLSRGDNWGTAGSNRNFTILIDDVLFNASNWYHSGDDWGMLKHYVPGWTDNTFGYPAYFSIDMGKPASYSRLKIYMRARTPLFSANIFTVFEVWGTNNPKALVPEQTDEDRLTNLKYWTSWEEVGGTDEWKNDWVQLGDYTLVLPSGATLTSDVITSEDEQFIRNGFDYEIDPDKTNIPCRYIRFVCKKSNFAGGKQQKNQMGELQFFGSYE
ncbi:MAG: DUF4959 domain-containing protein [Bacteroidales bacterium]|jgi:hypothetical protein|nr:DUF4959 domain-containing protein [Bacteroidales bacterium]